MKTGTAQGREGEIKTFDGKKIKGRFHKYTQTILTDENGVHYTELSITKEEIRNGKVKRKSANTWSAIKDIALTEDRMRKRIEIV